MLLAVSFGHRDVLVEEPHFSLERTVADAEHSGQAIGCFFDGSFLAGDVVVGVGFGDGVLVLSFAKAAENALEAVWFLFKKVVSALKFS